MKACEASARMRDSHSDSTSPQDFLGSFKVKAILMQCPCDTCPDGTTSDKCHSVSPSRMEAIAAFSGFDSDEPAFHSEVTKCHRKLLITLELSNCGKVSCKDEFIVITHVYDPVTKRTVRLLNAYVLKIRQEQMLQTYGLEFKQVVNGEAKEEVIDKRKSSFTGCEDLSDQPTCGVAYYHGTPVPGSHGFCCSCNSTVNVKRQLEYSELLKLFLAGQGHPSASSVVESAPLARVRQTVRTVTGRDSLEQGPPARQRAAVHSQSRISSESTSPSSVRFSAPTDRAVRSDKREQPPASPQWKGGFMVPSFQNALIQSQPKRSMPTDKAEKSTHLHQSKSSNIRHDEGDRSTVATISSTHALVYEKAPVGGMRLTTERKRTKEVSPQPSTSRYHYSTRPGKDTLKHNSQIAYPSVHAYRPSYINASNVYRHQPYLEHNGPHIIESVQYLHAITPSTIRYSSQFTEPFNSQTPGRKLGVAHRYVTTNTYSNEDIEGKVDEHLPMYSNRQAPVTNLRLKAQAIKRVNPTTYQNRQTEPKPSGVIERRENLPSMEEVKMKQNAFHSAKDKNLFSEQKSKEETQRKLNSLRRRIAITKANDRQLDLITDLFSANQKALKIKRPKRDMDRNIQLIESNLDGRHDNMEGLWESSDKESVEAEKLEDNGSFDDMDFFRVKDKYCSVEKRSPHGCGKKKNFKIQTNQTQEMEVESPRPYKSDKSPKEVANEVEKTVLSNTVTKTRSKSRKHAHRKAGGRRGKMVRDVDKNVDDDDENDDTEYMEGEVGGVVRVRRRWLRDPESRGARNCGDNYTPADLDSEKYHESAHCLRYSDLWYTVYSLKEPIIVHTVYMQLFEKQSLEDGTTHWQDLTRGKMVRLGTLWPMSEDETPTIAFMYRPHPPSTPPKFALNPSKVSLLIPQPVPKHKADKYPQVKGGPTEFLVVSKGEVGGECDKAGVSYQGFTNQQDRCAQPPGSCLKNQPADMWRSDTRAQQEGRSGRYFLGNYGTVPKDPIKSCNEDSEFLALEYHGPFSSSIDIEIAADANQVVRVGSSAQISEVYVDSTCESLTRLVVSVFNTGLASSSYRVLVPECPGAPSCWARAQGQLANIPPQHVKVTELKLPGTIKASSLHCSVEVVNCRSELVARRRIRFQRLDRCFCVWYCLCACIGTATGLGCDKMSPQHYHASGFQGSIPLEEPEQPDTLWLLLLVILLGLFALLLLLGLTKAILGLCCCPIVGAWGLNIMVFHPIRLEEYYEPHLAGRDVLYDEQGYPVHPDSHAHTVRAMSKHAEFCLNVVFFLVLPLTLCWMSCRRCCWICCCFGDYDGDAASHVVSTKHEDYICFEALEEDDDTQYVIEELKRSKESIEELDEEEPLLSTEADDYVKRLLNSKVVFRNLREPIGGVQLPIGIPYCIRGFFVKIPEGFEFTTPSPFKQYWIFEDGDLQMMQPPQNLSPELFEIKYKTAQEVFDHKQLSCLPKGFCVNVRFQDDMDFEDDDY